jgi:hypothetical protein
MKKSTKILLGVAAAGGLLMLLRKGTAKPLTLADLKAKVWMGNPNLSASIVGLSTGGVVAHKDPNSWTGRLLDANTIEWTNVKTPTKKEIWKAA